MRARTSRIAIAGAGSVGCYVGGRLVRAGRRVTFLLREPLAAALSRHGMRLSNLGEAPDLIRPSALERTADPVAALDGAHIVLVTVKCGATRAMADLIAAHAPAGAVVVSLQNGVDNPGLLQSVLGDRRVIAGMVPFNVMQTRSDMEAPRFKRASSGTIRIASGVPGLRDVLDVPGAPVAEHDDMTGVLWGKLVLNLNNALNALSGAPLAAELADRNWRLLLARQMDEALAALEAAGIRPARIEGVNPRLIPFALRLPDPVFRLVARGMLNIDPAARSSMWEDFEARRPTEIDHMQGAIVSLAEKHGVAAPLNRRVAELVKDVERAGRGAPRLSPDDVDAPAR